MFIYKNDPPESCWFTPTRDNLLATIDMPANYEVSFDVRPTGTLTKYSSLVHATAFDDNSRIPGFWFNPHNTDLHVVPGHVGSGNPYKNVGELPVGAVSQVRLIAFGPAVRCYIDGELRASWDNHERTAHEGVKLYAGDPWYIAAAAEIRHVEIRESFGLPA